MKLLTVRQPWAWALAVADGNRQAGKDTENRSRLTSHRGPVAIHAGLRLDRHALTDRRLIRLAGDHALLLAERTGIDPHEPAFPALAGDHGLPLLQPTRRGLRLYPNGMHTGVVLAVATLTDAHPPRSGTSPGESCCHPWGERDARAHWRLTGRRELLNPVPARGTLYLSDVPAALAAEIHHHLPEPT